MDWEITLTVHGAACARWGNHPFNRQMTKFNTLANATQPKYGTIKMPAANDLGQNAMVVAMIAISKATISMNAAPGMWSPRKWASKPRSEQVEPHTLPQSTLPPYNARRSSLADSTTAS